MFLSRQKFILLAFASIVAVSVGCLREQPSGPLNNGGAVTTAAEPVEPELPPDNQADIDALKTANAWLPADKTGRITSVELSSSATDEQLKHLAGLPKLARLQCNSRGITDEGLKLLKGHPSLRYID